MEVVEFEILQGGEGLEILERCLEKKQGMTVTGHPSRSVGHTLTVEGNRVAVLDRLPRCNADWTDYLRPRG